MPKRSPLVAAPASKTAIADRFVTMANAVTRQAHGLSLPEKRFLAAALAKSDLPDTRGLVDEKRQTVRITAAEYAESFDVSLDTAYEQLAAGALALQQPKIAVEIPGKRGPSVVLRAWIITGTYAKGEGAVTVRWHPDLVPVLFGLRREFTTYKLRHAAAFRSIYSWRLFECLKSWEGAGKWSPTIEEFADAMDAPKTYRANFKAIRERVIEPAVKELREKNGLLLDWEPTKAGRRVIALRFTFRPNPQGALF